MSNHEWTQSKIEATAGQWSRQRATCTILRWECADVPPNSRAIYGDRVSASWHGEGDPDKAADMLADAVAEVAARMAAPAFPVGQQWEDAVSDALGFGDTQPVTFRRDDGDVA